jgi:hypothetical protein
LTFADFGASKDSIVLENLSEVDLSSETRQELCQEEWFKTRQAMDAMEAMDGAVNCLRQALVEVGLALVALLEIGS